MFEISNVEHRYCEFNVRVMTDAVDRRLAASFAEGILLSRSLGGERIDSVVISWIDIIEHIPDAYRARRLLQAAVQ
jgi:hypothetical protein